MYIQCAIPYIFFELNGCHLLDVCIGEECYMTMILILFAMISYLYNCLSPNYIVDVFNYWLVESTRREATTEDTESDTSDSSTDRQLDRSSNSESDLSDVDEEGYCDEERATVELGLNLQRVELKRIKDLYRNTNKVYNNI